MNIRPRLEFRQVAGVFRVVARTAAFVHYDHHMEPNPEPVRDIKAGRSLDLCHWDVFKLGEVVADSLLPARLLRRLQSESP